MHSILFRTASCTFTHQELQIRELQWATHLAILGMATRPFQIAYVAISTGLNMLKFSQVFVAQVWCVILTLPVYIILEISRGKREISRGKGSNQIDPQNQNHGLCCQIPFGSKTKPMFWCVAFNPKEVIYIKSLCFRYHLESTYHCANFVKPQLNHVKPQSKSSAVNKSHPEGMSVSTLSNSCMSSGASGHQWKIHHLLR